MAESSRTTSIVEQDGWIGLVTVTERVPKQIKRRIYLTRNYRSRAHPDLSSSLLDKSIGAMERAVSL